MPPTDLRPDLHPDRDVAPTDASPRAPDRAAGGAAGEAVSRTLIDEFLAEQAATTAVERFAAWHERAPDRTARYRDLLPATPPGPGQQYAFDVDLDACSGCKACVVACSSLNGLDDGRSFRTVGTLVADADLAPGDRRELPVLRNVTTACHHCEDPGCLTGCPANAYDKDPDTGVVRHLDDQCIGCQYCTLTCPYEVPAYDADRGIVRKCDLCHDRLVEGEAPACVQACPTDAITIRTVDLEDVDAEAPAAGHLDGHAVARPDGHAAGQAGGWPFPAPSPTTTRPTTRFRSSEDLTRRVVAADDGAAGLAHAHPPLTVMLVLTQLAVGTLVVLLATLPWLPAPLGDAVAPVAAGTALATAVVALGASVLHLGRPLQAWRAVLGIGHSWLSREIVAFGAFAPLAAAAAAALAGWEPFAPHAGWLAPLAAGAGLVGVGTSVMVYAVCGRRWWSWPRTGARFGATTLLGGLATVLVVVTGVGAVADLDATAAVVRLATASGLLAVAVTVAEVGLWRHRRGPVDDELARTARLLHRQLPALVGLRVGLVMLGAGALPWLSWVMLSVSRTSPAASVVTATLGLVAVLAGELIDRWRFFTASAPPRMPGAAWAGRP